MASKREMKMNDYEMARPNEAKMIDMAESGLISWEELARVVLGRLEDTDIYWMAEQEFNEWK